MKFAVAIIVLLVSVTVVRASPFFDKFADAAKSAATGFMSGGNPMEPFMQEVQKMANPEEWCKKMEEATDMGQMKEILTKMSTEGVSQAEAMRKEFEEKIANGDSFNQLKETMMSKFPSQ